MFAKVFQQLQEIGRVGSNEANCGIHINRRIIKFEEVVQITLKELLQGT